MSHQIIFGTSVLDNEPPVIDKPKVFFSGLTKHGDNGFYIDDDLFARHILMIGGSGCGKTNAFNYTIESIFKSMTENDIAIIFDTKGEFYDTFSRKGDYVIGNSKKFRDVSYTWNIFDEITADGYYDSDIIINAGEIACALFNGRGSESQPFFCNAARDIFKCILVYFLRQASKDDEFKEKINNRSLINAFRSLTHNNYLDIFNAYDDFKSMKSYIGDGVSSQALGVFGELNSMLSDHFMGIFAEHNPARSMSMRNAVRKRGAKAIFIEYDLSVGETLAPIYRLLTDQALKEALGQSGKKGNVYLIADEFKLLPRLQHIDDALNFGRGMGVKVMAGIQSIDQLYDIYGREKGAVIASGFGSVFAFHTNDSSSREYIRKRFGSNVMVYDYNNLSNNSVESRERDGYTVEEWDQLMLGLGQAVIGLGYEAPFLFQFSKF